MRKHQTLIVGLVVVLLCSSVLAQNSRTLLVEQPLGNDPIRVVKIMEGTVELTSDGQQFPDQYAWESVFNGGSDWIKDILL